MQFATEMAYPARHMGKTDTTAQGGSAWQHTAIRTMIGNCNWTRRVSGNTQGFVVECARELVIGLSTVVYGHTS